MSRATWKGPYLEKSLIKLAKKIKTEMKFENSITSRKTVIIPFFIGKTFSIHNGKVFMKIKVTDEMLGHKFGEFSPTRKQFTYKKKKKK